MTLKTYAIFSSLSLALLLGIFHPISCDAAQISPQTNKEQEEKPLLPPSSINLDTATTIDASLFEDPKKMDDFLGYSAKYIPKDANLPPFLRKMHDDWAKMQQSYSPESFTSDNTFMTPKNAHKWKFFYKKIQKASPIDQLRGINGFMNTIPSKDDKILYKTEEYWASPQEMFTHWAGDCEDYVFAKYYALKYFGWSEKDLRVYVVYNKTHKMPHAILAVQLEGNTYILDNLAEPKHKLLQPEHYSKKSLPLFALSTQGIWIYDKAFQEYLEKYRKPKKEGLAEKRAQKKAQNEKSAP